MELPINKVADQGAKTGISHSSAINAAGMKLTMAPIRLRKNPPRREEGAQRGLSMYALTFA